MMILHLRKPRSYREYPLENGRIDLLIECHDSFVLGIENKIYSPEGDNQTPYYAHVMAGLFPDVPYHLAFLTLKGNKARSKQFIPISYPMLLTALKEVAIHEAVEPRKRVLWQDFLEHLEVYFMMTNPDHFEFSEKSRLYLEHYEMLQDLKNTFEREWDQVFSYLENHFQEQATGGPWSTNFQTRFAWKQAYKPHWLIENLNIHFEWSLSLPAFIEGKMSFGVDVQGKRTPEALAWFDAQYPLIAEQYQQRGIRYRPKNRNNAIAHKIYPISMDVDQVAERLVESFNEFRFLEPLVDEVMAKLSTKV